MRAKWKQNEIDFLIANYSKESVKNISQILKRSVKSIYLKAHKLQLINVRNWTENEDEILKTYYGKTEFDNYCNKLFNRTYSAVLNRSYQLNLKQDFRFEKSYKYNVNHDFFKIVNNLNSYWAGFIAADGYVKSDCNALGIKLSTKDKGHIEKFKSDIMSDSPIKFKKNNSFNKQTSAVEIIIYSHKIVNDLMNNFNITTKKTFSLCPPNLLELNHKLSFVSGLIDGDGSVYNANKKVITILGTKKILEWCKNIIGTVIDINGISIIQKENIFSFCITGERTTCLYQTIKKLQNPILERKWNSLI